MWERWEDNAMKRWTACLLALWMMLLGAGALAEWATVDNPNPADRLNLRTAPSESAQSSGKYYNGTRVKILSGPKDGWYRVRAGLGNGVCDVNGYMKAKYLAVGAAGDDVADMRPTVTLTQDMHLVSFYSGSNVGKVYSGQALTVMGVGTKYLHVLTADGKCGLVPADCVTPRISFSAEDQQARWATVDNPNPADRLHLRARADRNAISYGKYYSGTQVELLSGPENGWYRVRVGGETGGIEGYMMEAYLCTGRAASGVYDSRPEVTLSSETGAVPLYYLHTGSCIGKAQNGTLATVLGVGTQYLHVQLADGTTGFVPVEQATPRVTY